MKKFYKIEIVYEEPVNKCNNYLSIDLWLNNLITAIENKNSHPLIVSRRFLKAINQQWNKGKARLSSNKYKQELR
ncbi:MAG: hypothetical protein ACFFAS_04960 [Promethearchaeota archaeon]